jgi:hypothetical protein
VYPPPEEIEMHRLNTDRALLTQENSTEQDSEANNSESESEQEDKADKDRIFRSFMENFIY